MRKLIFVAAIAAAGLTAAACSREDRTDIKDGAVAVGSEVKEAAGDIADARRVAPSSAQEEAEAYKLSREGRRQGRALRAEQVERNIGDTALSIKEAAPSVLGEPAGGAVLRSPTGQPLTLRIEDQAALAKSIGKETADALRAVPPKVQLPADPNTFKGN